MISKDSYIHTCNIEAFKTQQEIKNVGTRYAWSKKGYIHEISINLYQI